MIHLYKTCRCCWGLVSEEWDFTNYEAIEATAKTINELMLQ